MEKNILIPFGNQTGETTDPAEAIWRLTGEVAKQALVVSTLYQNSEDEWERKQFYHEYKYLEKLLTILFAIYYQMEPRVWEAEPRYGMIPAAKEHDLVLPEWMKLP